MEESGSCTSVQSVLESTHSFSIVDGCSRLRTHNFTPEFTYVYAVRTTVATSTRNSGYPIKCRQIKILRFVSDQIVAVT